MDFSKFDKKLLSSLIEYTDQGYKKLNACLIAGKRLDEDSQRILDDIDAIFEMTDPITEPLTLYRGVTTRNLKQCDMYISASLKEDIANAFAGRNCCIIVFTILPGTKVLYLESISDQPDEEVLIERGGTFHITLVEGGQTSGKKDRIYMTYIPKQSESSKRIEPLVEKAAITFDVVQRVLNIFSKDEYELFKDDEEQLDSSINEILKSIDITDQQFVQTIKRKLRELYDEN